MGIVSLIRETGEKHAGNQHVLGDSYLDVISRSHAATLSRKVPGR